MAKLISQSCGELQPAVCLPRGYAAIWMWPVHLWMSDKPQKQATAKSHLGNFQHQYLAELLVNVYSYRLMAKSASCCCIRGSQLFSNLVTYTPYLLEMCLPAYVTGVTVICVSPGIMFPAHISLYRDAQWYMFPSITSAYLWVLLI